MGALLVDAGLDVFLFPFGHELVHLHEEEDGVLLEAHGRLDGLLGRTHELLQMVHIAQAEQGVGIEQELQVVHILVLLGPGRELHLAHALIELGEDLAVLGLFPSQEAEQFLELGFRRGLDQAIVEDLAPGLDFLGGQEDVGSLEYSSHIAS